MIRMLFQVGSKSKPSNGTLADLSCGQRAIVTSISGSGLAAQRLYEMGILEGTEVTLVRVAPMGDPLEIRLMGYALSLRKAEAAMIQVDLA